MVVQQRQRTRDRTVVQVQGALLFLPFFKKNTFEGVDLKLKPLA